LRRDAEVNDFIGKYGRHAVSLSDSLAKYAARRQCAEIQIDENNEKGRNSDKGLNCARHTVPFPMRN
jgi:hypothetical protein